MLRLLLRNLSGPLGSVADSSPDFFDLSEKGGKGERRWRRRRQVEPLQAVAKIEKRIVTLTRQNDSRRTGHPAPRYGIAALAVLLSAVAGTPKQENIKLEREVAKAHLSDFDRNSQDHRAVLRKLLRKPPALGRRLVDAPDAGHRGGDDEPDHRRARLPAHDVRGGGSSLVSRRFKVI